VILNDKEMIGFNIKINDKFLKVKIKKLIFMHFKILTISLTFFLEHH